MKRRLTFSTHAFAKQVLAVTTDMTCYRLVDMLCGRDPEGLDDLAPRHVAAWVRKQYPDEDVREFFAYERGWPVLVLKSEVEDGIPRHARRKAMAERLLAKPDRRASITVDL